LIARLLPLRRIRTVRHLGGGGSCRLLPTYQGGWVDG